MCATYASSSSGMHHIFFPPRLQLVLPENVVDALPTDRGDNAPRDRLLYNEAHCPAGSAGGRCRAYHRHDFGLVTLRNSALWPRTRLVMNGDFQALFEKTTFGPAYRRDRRPSGGRDVAIPPAFVQ